MGTFIATTTFARYDTEHERVRAECSIKLIDAAVAQGYKLVAIDGGSPNAYIEIIQAKGAVVSPQSTPGMGNARRQALREASALASEYDSIVWTEPEKYPLMPLLGEAIDGVEREHYDLVMLRRTSLASYPPEQAHAYSLIALAMKYLTGIDCDFGWGPTVLSQNAIPYYLNYKGEYGDVWDSIHCPKLHIIHDGLPWTIVDVPYQHPPEQTAAETGMPLFLKRVRQVENLVEAIEAEVNRLGMRI